MFPVVLTHFTTMFRCHQDTKKCPNVLGWFDGVSQLFWRNHEFLCYGFNFTQILKHDAFKKRETNKYSAPLIKN